MSGNRARLVRPVAADGPERARALPSRASGSPVPAPRWPIVAAALAEPGGALEPATRHAMEERFGHSFADVRVHEGPRASRSARALGADAYAVAPHVVLGEHAGDAPREELLAHELAHVVQQRGGPSEGVTDAERESAEGHAQEAARSTATHRPVPRFASARAAPLMLKPARAQDGDVFSGTRPRYGVDDVKEALATYALGPIAGSDLVRELDAGDWTVLFWRQTGQIGRTIDAPGRRVILLPREKPLAANVVTLFHEGMHATRPVPGSTGSVEDVEAIWANLEEEVQASWETFRFVRANAPRRPELLAASPFAGDWEGSALATATPGTLVEYFRYTLVPWIALANYATYAALLRQFGNDFGKLAETPRVTAILNRVILGERPGPGLAPPEPPRLRWPSLIRPRPDFRREVLESVKQL